MQAGRNLLYSRAHNSIEINSPRGELGEIQMIEVIESPDLRFARYCDEALAKRRAAAALLQLRSRVKAGTHGKPGTLETISDRGYVSIRWDCGSLLCGVSAVDVLPHDTVQ